KMGSLEATRAELGLAVLYLNKAEARDKICRAIQYGSKFISNGQPGTAQNVDKSTTLARKVFRLLKWVNDLHALISPAAKGTPLTLVLLGKVQECVAVDLPVPGPVRVARKIGDLPEQGAHGPHRQDVPLLLDGLLRLCKSSRAW
uniref:Uncharacterized protein n=1 Tax=Aegilops tauschii subsp. strangulata TaxID=200361 RepID=A0A453J7G2_AEGTS